ncbi:MAG: ABC transporter permease subunit [Deltaproteobacteria bacterium]|nr:ABC transporter permease subunit [Deltaproteobacteria bacterium]
MRIAWLVAKKELLEIRRDMRTLVLLVAAPALLYPLLLMGAASLSKGRIGVVDQRKLHIGVGADVPDSLQLYLAQTPNIYVLSGAEASTNSEKASHFVDAKVVRAPLSVDDNPSFVLLADSSLEGGRSATRRVEPLLYDWVKEFHESQLRQRDVPDALLQQGRISVVDTAPAVKKSGFLLSRIVVPLLIVMLLLGAFYPAIDMTSGERERSTLVTLLAAPAPPLAIAAGKFIAVTVLSLTAAIANLVGMALTSTLGLAFLPSFALPVSTLVLLVVVIVPLALYTSAILLAASTLAQTTKEAQTYLTPVFLLLSFPAVAAVLPGVQATWQSALIPVFGPALVLREILAQTATFELVFAGLVGAFLVIIVAIGLASKAFSVEAILTGRVARPLRLNGPLDVFDAVLLTLALLVAFLLMSVALSSYDVLTSLWLSQGLVFLGLPVLVVVLRCKHPLQVLGLVRPSGGWVIPLLVFASWPIAAALGEWLGQTLFTVDEALLKQLEALAQSLEGRSPVVLFLSFAVLPALCEEMAFRGSLLSAAKRPWLGVVVVAVVFAVFHGSLMRAPITFIVGLFVGLLRVKTGSLFPSILLHLTHNGVALLIAASLATDEKAVVDLTAPQPVYAGLPLPLLVGSAVAVLVLVGILLREMFASKKHDDDVK